MATIKHNPADLLGAHVRGSYVYLETDDLRLTCSFDGIVESVVLNLDPSHGADVFVAGEYHSLDECRDFEIVLPPAMADHSIASTSAIRAF